VSNLLATIETWTPFPTDTPTATPTITPTPSAAQIAQAGVEHNADWEPYAPLENDFNGVTMVLVPAGCFMMGSDPDGQQWDGQQWVIGVTDGGSQCFDAPFWIDKHEITNANYGSLGCREQSDDPRQPRNCVNWFNAQSFCQSREARLPTEAEWEYAARGPDSLYYPWGNPFNADNVIDSSDFPRETFETGTAIEGGSWAGALDMSGNEWEWTSSLFGEYPYDKDDGREADAGDNPNVLRSLRGGSFRSAERDLRSATRHRLFPNNTIDDLGFRCARDYQ
jgi:iron(II)-dependent oxidoreductase